MKNTYLLLSSIIIALLLSACGSGSASQKGTSESSITVVDCNGSNVALATNDCNVDGNFTCYQSSDTLVEDTRSSSVQIITDTSGTKKVCIVSGSAHLVR